MNKPAVCIATIRPDSFKQWLEAWQEEFFREGVKVFAIWDVPCGDDFMSTDTVAAYSGGVAVEAWDQGAIAKELEDKAWIIPKRTSACKSFAIYKAWKAGCDPIIVLDDDCLPYQSAELVKQHQENLRHSTCNLMALTVWHIKPRGVPHLDDSPIALSHGLWMENPDIDAITQLSRNDYGGMHYPNRSIPQGALFPMSGMNLAFRRDIAPLMYFGLQGPDWGVDRFDDIWCGFLAKKVLDHCGYAVWSGTPYVRHIKASDPFVNIVKEAPGYKMNVELYEWVMNEQITNMFSTRELGKKQGKVQYVLRNLAAHMVHWENGNDYWKKYGQAILEWLELFEPEEAFGI